MRTLLLIACLLASQAHALAADQATSGDIRDLRIGMTVAEVNASNYRELRCEGAGPHVGERIERLQQFGRCDADAQGQVTLGLAYAPVEDLARVNDRFDGTKLGGHPVTLNIGVDAAGRVQAIGVRTDPQTSRYLRKKAFLLGARIKARFGAEDWQCARGEPAAELQAVGGVFINETCEKRLADRRLTLQTRLYRRDAQPEPEVVNETRLDIRALPAAPG